MKRLLLSALFVTGFFTWASAQELIASFQNLTISGNTFSFDIMLAPGGGYNASTSINGGAASLRFNITNVAQPTGGPQTSVVASEFYPSYSGSGLASFSGGTVNGSAKFAVNINPGGADPFLLSSAPIKICRLSVTSPSPIPTATAIVTMRPSTSGPNATASGGSGYSYTGFSSGIISTSSPVNLPVVLAYFKAQQSNTSSLLSWGTKSEQHNSGFDIERSPDGKTFSKIGFVPSQATAGTSASASDYTYTDLQPANGLNQYRLKQVSLDGKTTYSNIVSLVFGSSNALTAFPNPTRDKLVIQGVNNGQTLILSDLSGRTISRRVVAATTETLDLSGSAAGTYLVSIYDSGALLQTIKVVKN